MAYEEESRLVDRIVAGEERAVEQFVRDYRPFIYAYAILTRHMGLPSEDADEVFQRFLFRIWENGYQRLRAWSRKASLRAYLGSVSRNLAQDYRREQRLSARCESSEEPNADDRGNTERKRMIEVALPYLSSRDRDLIHRRYYQQQSYREIGAALGMTTNHVGVALFRAERRLKQIVDGEKIEQS